MEIFINELSLEGQYFTQNQFEEAITKFSEMFAVIKKDVQVFKEDTLIYAPTIRDEVFSASFEKIADRSLKDAFRNIVFNKINPKNWKAEQVHSEDDAYFYFDKNEDMQDVSGKTLAEIAERNLQTKDTKRLALNFMESRYDSPLTICKNSKENKISVDCADDKVALVKWLGETEKPATDFLKNKERFSSTSKESPLGTIIYKEIETGYYWHFDNFHADEFEVYDKNGKHIGVADLEGNVDFDKAVKGRSISDVL